MTEVDRETLRSQVMRTGWPELVPHFARGALLWVAPDRDLLDAATAIAEDDRARVEGYLKDGTLAKFSDAQAQRFQAEDAVRFQVLIVQPFVLAQVLS